MERHVFVVSRDNFELYAYLKEQFAPDSEVEIILDRRRGERRIGMSRAAENRRRGERRARPDLDLRLRLESHVFFTLPAANDSEPVISTDRQGL
jgi:hypothetical protein